MDIKTMLKREDFYKILKVTLEEYMTTTDCTNVNLIFYKNLFKGKYVCYERINVLTRRKTNKRHMHYILSEFNIRGHLLKYVVAKVLVYSYFMSKGLLANISFDIINYDGDDIMIWPCNRTIRIFNFDKDIVISILKKGYPSSFMQNSISFRLKSNYSFLLPIDSYSNNSFTEKILKGNSLARVTDEFLYALSVKKVIDNIGVLSQDTLKFISYKKYIELLIKDINYKLNIVDEKKDVKMSKELLNNIERIDFALIDDDIMIPLAISHGDLQLGNIWVDERNDVYIIDWETVSERSVWYDIAVFLGFVRTNSGLTQFIKNFDILNFHSSLHYLNHENLLGFELIAPVIVLEDILFYIEDLLSLPNNYGSERFDQYILENIDAFKYLKILNGGGKYV